MEDKIINRGDSIEFKMMELINDETREINVKGTVLAVFGKTIRVQYSYPNPKRITIIDLEQYLVSKIENNFTPTL